MRGLIVLFLFCYYGLSYSVEDKSYFIEADIVEYDNDKNTVTATGHIEILRDEYTLKADKIVYNQITKQANAYGNVTLTSKTGDVVTADTVEINNTIKEAIASLATARFDTDSKFKAKKVYYNYPNKAVFEQVTYTPCPLCEDKSPQWQIKSSKIKYEKEGHTSYLNNIFEVHGIPVFYFPYFMTASPDAPPRSGFLFPNRQTYTNLYGYGIVTPYYLRIADNKDFLYSPMITTKQGILHSGKFRHLLENGSYSLEGNYIKTSQQSLVYVPEDRFHFLTNVDYKLNDTWRFESKIEGVSDKSYLHNYWNKSPNYLTSNASFNYLNDRSYGSIESYAFQGLRANDSRSTDPRILPLMDYHHEIFLPVGKTVIEANTVNIMRNKGVDSRRLTTKIGWDKTYYYGYQEFTVVPNFRADFYRFQHKGDAIAGSGVTNTKQDIIRTVPELELIWKFPLISNKMNNSFYLEPIANIILSPNNSKNQDIINEDSQEVELNDTNLFSTNRYSGFDRIEQGLRASYGARASGIANWGTEYNLLLGQSYRAQKDPSYFLDSGLYDKYFSDIVGRLGLKPHKTTELYYRGRLDSQTYDIRRNEIGVNFDVPTKRFVKSVHLNANHIHYNYISQIDPNQVHQSLSLNGRIDINDEWYVGSDLKRSASHNSSFPISTRFNVGYKGECATITLSALKDYTTDPSRNIKPSSGFSLDLDVHLKNIG